ncbi:hypothetical protein VNI00_019114 [Paramarasmius palmivorus]|uniref:Mus7/MMS22 family-domain-containing protein n=1 Tax=Paramarasmius palmivorus TaxID=297713 RepID=A0AAW0AR71_9AGAR
MQNTETEQPNPEEYVETSEPEEIEVCWKRKRNGEVEAYPAKRKRVELGLDSDESVSSPIEDVHSELPHEALEQMSLEVDNASDYMGMDMDMDASQDPLNLLIPSQGTPPPPTSDRDTDPMTPATSIFSSEPPRSSFSPPPPPLPVPAENSQDPLCLSAGAGEEREEEGQDLGLFGDDEDEDDRPLGSPTPFTSTRERGNDDDVEVFSLHSRSPSPIARVQPSSPLSSPPRVPVQPLSPPLQPQLEPELQLQPQLQPPQPPAAADDAAPFIPPEEGGGYRFRNRKPEQKNPFLFDRYMYEKLMANNPDAIVRMKLGDSQSGRRHARGPEDRYEEEESQEQGFVPPEGEESDVEEERVREREKGKEKEKVPDGLSELESDEDPETKGSRKEYLKLKKRKKEEERQKKKLEKKEKEKGKGKKPHAFPVRPEQEEEEESRAMDVSSDHEEGQAMDTNQDSDGNASEQERRRRRLFSRSRSRLVPDSDEEPVAGPSYERSQSRNGRSTGFSSPTPSYNLPRNLSPFPGDPSPSSLAGQAYDFDFGMSFGDDDNELPRQPSPLVIDDSSSDHENQGGDHLYDASSSRSDSEGPAINYLSKKDRKNLRDLGQMVPKSMIAEWVQEKTDARKSKPTRPVPEETPGRLLPGQSRKKTGTGNGQKAILGDPESSDEEREPARSRSPSPQPVASSSRQTIHSYFDAASHRPAVPSRKGKGKEVQQPIIVISDDDEGCSSADEVDCADIDHYLHARPMVNHKKTHSLPVELPDLALIKNVKIRPPRSSSVAKSSKASSGRTGQSKPQSKAPGRTDRGATGSTSSSRSAPSDWDVHPEPVPVDDAPASKLKKKQAKRKKVQERKRRAQLNGLYTFADGNMFLQSHVEPQDFYDETLESALVPSPESQPPLVRDTNARKSILQPPPPLTQAQEPVVQGPTPTQGSRIEKNIPQSELLRPGIGFGDQTLLGRRWLNELTHLDSSTDIRVPHRTRFGFQVGPETTCPQLKDLLHDVCDRVLDFAEALPSQDYAEDSRDWNDLLSGICSCFSMHMLRGDKESQEKLRLAACQQVEKIIKRLDNDDLPKNSVDLILLNITWFAVEILFRAGYRAYPPPPSLSPETHLQSDLLVAAMTLAARYAYACGMIEALAHIRYSPQPINDTTSGDKSSILARSAEVWICLIHLSIYSEAPPGKGEVLWKIIEGILQSRTASLNSYNASETMWSTIFNVCALSQISDLGIRTAKPAIPGSWNVVAYALKRVKLEDASNRGFDEVTARKHDGYSGLLIMRCFLLTSRWGWVLDDFQIINILSRVFRNRRFANLVQDEAEYPTFLRQQNWDTCREFNKTDSSFERFLKLVVQAGKAKVNIVKLCSLIIPVAHATVLPHMTADQKESMLYNRFSSLAVSIHLDPKGLEKRIRTARSLIDFAGSPDNVRTAHIRSVFYLSYQLVVAHLPTDEVFAWLGEIAEVLLKELAAIEASENLPHGRNASVVVFCSQMLIGVVRYVVVGYKEVGEYPDPAMLGKLSSLLRNKTLTSYPSTTKLIAKLINSYLDARKEALSPKKKKVPPPTQDAAPTEEDSQETQYPSEDIDYDDPQLAAALDVGAPPPQAATETTSSPPQDYRSKELLLAKYLEPLKHKLYTPFSKAIQDVHENEGRDECITAWIRCFSVGMKKNWDLCLTVCVNTWGKLHDPRWLRCIKIRCLHTILKEDPGAYAVRGDQFLEVLFHALVPDEPTIQHQYVSFLLSADGLKHVLLKDLPVGPGTSGNYELTAEDLQAKRVSLVHCIFRNVNQALASGDQKGKTYSDWCAGLLSGMRERFNAAQDHGKQQQLRDICLQIADLFVEELPSLAAKLEWWPNWARGLRQ